jgi:hypothetical protein
MEIDDILKYGAIAALSYAGLIVAIYLVASWRIPKMIKKLLKRGRDDKKR